jgi:hypothetical protein
MNQPCDQKDSHAAIANSRLDLVANNSRTVRRQKWGNRLHRGDRSSDGFNLSKYRKHMLLLHFLPFKPYTPAQRTLGSCEHQGVSAMAQRFIAYERVSTARQGASGLGLEAQRQSIDGFAASRGAEVLARFTEVESGKTPNRPQLTAAIQLARLTGATLVIAKLDRLSRNAGFLLTLRDSGVHFLAVDMPGANDLTVGIMALVAQAEREAISKRS